jgi:hypothetical protein
MSREKLTQLDGTLTCAIGGLTTGRIDLRERHDLSVGIVDNVDAVCAKAELVLVMRHSLSAHDILYGLRVLEAWLDRRVRDSECSSQAAEA